MDFITKINIKNYNMLTPKQRAIILYKKYTREYNRRVCMGKMYQTEEWKEVTKELKKLYEYEDK
jgi:hypothetical protein